MGKASERTCGGRGKSGGAPGVLFYIVEYEGATFGVSAKYGLGQSVGAEGSYVSPLAIVVSRTEVARWETDNVLPETSTTAMPNLRFVPYLVLVASLVVAACRTTAVKSTGTTAPTRPASRSVRVAPPDSSFISYFSGDTTDAQTSPAGGALLAGGGTDSEAGMRWLLAQGGSPAAGAYGDVVVLRASGSDGYNDYLLKFGANSVTSIVIRSVDGANNAFVRRAIARAEVVFLAGGDQSRYERFWRGTALQQAVNARVAEGYPLGGTSAGLAVLGEFGYSALNESAQSKVVLKDPFDSTVTFERSLFTVPHLTNLITDSHFAVRDRMGRLLAFLGRLELLYGAQAPRAIAVDEKSAVAVSASGRATVFGGGKGAYLLSTSGVTTRTVARATPLTYAPVAVLHVPVGGQFDLATWTTSDAVAYTLSVIEGVVTSSNGAIY